MPHHLLHQPALATFAVTTAAVALSVAVTQATMWWVGYDAGYLPALLAGAIPALMVPFTVYPLASANRRLRTAQGELERIALTDVLTDLPNRRAFFESAERMLATPATADHPVAALMIDVDHFKAINDSQATGRATRCSARLRQRSAMRSPRRGPRTGPWRELGGEEFAVLTAGLAPTEVARLGEQLCHAARQLGQDLPASGHGDDGQRRGGLRQGDEDGQTRWFKRSKISLLLRSM